MPSLRSMAGNRITKAGSGSRLPFEEIRNQAQTQPLAFFRMKLGARSGVVGNDRGNWPTIVGIGNEVGIIRSQQMKGVHKIGMQALGTKRDAAQQGMRPA